MIHKTFEVNFCKQGFLCSVFTLWYPYFSLGFNVMLWKVQWKWVRVSLYISRNLKMPFPPRDKGRWRHLYAVREIYSVNMCVFSIEFYLWDNLVCSHWHCNYKKIRFKAPHHILCSGEINKKRIWFQRERMREREKEMFQNQTSTLE